MGIGNGAKVFSIVFGTFFPVWLNTHHGVRLVPTGLLWSAATMRRRKTDLLWGVLLPAALPFTLVGVRLAISMAFVMVFVSELAGASSGIGYQIAISQQAYRTDRMMAALVVLGALGASADVVFNWASRRWLPWLLSGPRKTKAAFELLSEPQNRTALHGVTVQNLSVKYGNHVVLQDVSFEVRPGEFVAIVGRSGSGKTTLLNVIAGFTQAEGGVSRPTRLGVVFQDHATFPWLTASGNIAFGLRPSGESGSSDVELRKIVSHHIDRAGLVGLEDRYPSQMSGGQIQRVGIARALAPQPDLLLMDEPYGALDRYTRDQMQSWLLSIWSEHRPTVIFVTHDIEEAVFLADRVLVLMDGSLEASFEVPFTRPRSDDIKFSQTFVDLRRQITSLIRQSNHTIFSSTSTRGTS
jgi:NitT/TauT family transport system ATP-binding protein